MKPIDWIRFAKGSNQLTVSGVANTKERKQLVEEAIALIQKDRQTALLNGYLGFKNYAQFGDQRCDCEYGMGPRHGYVVFDIGRNRDRELNDPESAIYFLKCFRDAVGRPYKDGNNYERQANIQQTYKKMRLLEEESGSLQEWLDAIKVDEDSEELVTVK
jgi:hypothetical protein